MAFVKGAPKEILALCTGVRLDGQDTALDAAQRQAVLEANDRMARAGMRVLAVASDGCRRALMTSTPKRSNAN